MNRSVAIVVIAVCVGVLLVLVFVKALSSKTDPNSDFELRTDFRDDFSNKTAFKAIDLPQPLVCGSFIDPRISGGEETEISEFPWMALIEHTRPDGSVSYHCGGTIINENHVLTAAHCVNGKYLIENKWSVSGVRLGEWDLTTDPDCEEDLCADPVVDIPIAELIVHEKYQPYSKDHEYDIALLRLNQPVKFTKWIKPLCLPTASNLRSKQYNGSNVYTVAGWGRTEVPQFSDRKLKVELIAVPLNQCVHKYNSKGVTLTENQLCAGGKSDGKDACKGDSGGPLMQIDNSNRLKPFMFLAGIVSFGKKSCGKTGWPGIYTRVDRYTDWILQHMTR